MPYPKIELHVHLEGTVRPATLLEIARRNDFALPADTVEGLAELYRFTDFAHFIEVWIMTTAALQTADDFRQIVVDYAAEAAAHGAVYIEAIFAPPGRCRGELLGRGLRGLLRRRPGGARDARRRGPPDAGHPPRGRRRGGRRDRRVSVAYRDRGVVGLGLGGPEADFAPEPYAPAFDIARAGGLASVPHAGEVAGVESIRGALETLGADRIRTASARSKTRRLSASSQPAASSSTCARCPTCAPAASPLAEHPLPTLIAAGIPLLSTDDPAMFDTDLGREYDAATAMGLSPRGFFDAGVEGALCDEATKGRPAPDRRLI